ncbi:hypothetical protein BH23GEM5_BH23GEM5_14700 [soil metagenome]
MALAGDREGLEEMRQLVQGTEALREWTATVEAHFRDLELVSAILDAVAANPGCLQTEIKATLGKTDGPWFTRLIGLLEKGGRLVRAKEKNTYRLYLPGGSDRGPKATAASISVRSHRAGSPAIVARKVDVRTLPLVPLPPSPPHWQQRDRLRALVSLAIEEFEVRDAPSWYLREVNTIPASERPDPSFRRLYAMAEGLLAVDDLGRGEGVRAPAAAIRYARDGRVVARAPLRRDIYRLEVC